MSNNNTTKGHFYEITTNHNKKYSVYIHNNIWCTSPECLNNKICDHLLDFCTEFKMQEYIHRDNPNLNFTEMTNKIYKRVND